MSDPLIRGLDRSTPPERLPSVIGIVDDEPTMLRAIRRLLRDAGYETIEESNGAGALEMLGARAPDLLLCDIRLPPPDGIEVLRVARDRHPDMPVIMLTGEPSVEGAVQALKDGAYHYITKPFDADELRLVVAKALELRALSQENRRLRRDIRDTFDFSQLIGISRPFTALIERVKRIVDTNSTVLITGESGTGKDVLARAIHYNSPRRERSFVAVNCPAIPESLMESELFGHTKGAFTGAHAPREGLFEEANRGTIFLDEIGDLPLSMQTRLLHVIQNREVRRVGAVKPTQVDVRIICATNKDLEKMVAEGRFRDDLFFRINILRIRMPSLDERKEDIPLLARHFAALYARQHQRNARRCRRTALEALQARRWPGNVRELANCIEQAVLWAEGTELDERDLGLAPLGAPDDPPARRDPSVPPAAPLPASDGSDYDLKVALDRAIAAIERDYIGRALKETGGNRTRAAQVLGISHRNLMYKLKEYPELAAR